jgi:hypothetical protein
MRFGEQGQGRAPWSCMALVQSLRISGNIFVNKQAKILNNIEA